MIHDMREGECPGSGWPEWAGWQCDEVKVEDMCPSMFFDIIHRMLYNGPQIRRGLRAYR
jgi:hypothetical protein